MTETLKKMPKTVIFDMDGLLFDSERLTYGCVNELLAKYGCFMTESAYVSLIGKPFTHFVNYFAANFPEIGDAQRFDDECLKLVRSRYETRGVPLKSGAIELLQYLSSRGIPRVLATSTRKALAERALRLSGVFDYMTYCVYGDEVPNGKPAPDIFLIAARHGGASPADSLVLEDSPSGITAAFAAKIPVIMVPDMLPCSDELSAMTADCRSDLFEVKALLEALPE